jgi:hypothetical protein
MGILLGFVLWLAVLKIESWRLGFSAANGEHNKDSQRKTDRKRTTDSKPETWLTRLMARTKMESAAFIILFVFVVSIAIVIGSIANRVHWTIPLWLGCFAIDLAFVGGACYLHDKWTKQDAKESSPHSDAVATTQPAINREVPNSTGTLTSFNRFLTPGDGPVPPEYLPSILGDISKAPPDIFFALLGNSAVFDNNFPFVVLRHGDENIITIERDGDGILISAKFYDKDGKMVCELVKNELRTNEKSSLFWKSERKAHWLGVFSDEKTAVCEIEFINKNTVRILGDFYAQNAFPIVIKPDEQIFGKMHFSGNVFGQAPCAISVQ